MPIKSSAPPCTSQDPHNQNLDSLFTQYCSAGAGLSSRDARSRLENFGPNILKVKQGKPLILKFLGQFGNFFAILLIIGGCLALLAERLDPGQGNIYIASALFVVVLLNALFTFAQEFQSERIMDSFTRMLPTRVKVYRDDKVTTLDAAELVPGDVLLLQEGDKVPADCRLLEVAELKVDQSSLTGESEPILLDPEHRAENLLESRNMVFSGSLVQSGNGRVLVCHTGMDTQIGKIVQLTKEVDEVETPIRKELKHFIKIISTIAISLGSLFFLISIAMGKGSIGALIFAIGIIVANVPEGLLPTVTLALTMASKRMAKKNALIKNLESVETLGSTTVICTDKTGTLTQNRITVHSIRSIDSTYTFGRGDFEGASELLYLRRIMVLCNNAQVDEAGNYSGDSTETALLSCADAIGDLESLAAFERVAEQPFTSATKFMITAHRLAGAEGCETYVAKGFEAYMKGAPEIVLAKCDRVWVGNKAEALDEQGRSKLMASLEAMAGEGQRCLGLAFRPQDDENITEGGYIFVGIAGSWIHRG